MMTKASRRFSVPEARRGPSYRRLFRKAPLPREESEEGGRVGGGSYVQTLVIPLLSHACIPTYIHTFIHTSYLYFLTSCPFLAAILCGPVH